MPVPYLACMLAAASFYHLPPRVLPSIQAVEGGRPGLISRNTDGSADLGLMQVNTLWIRRFSEVTHLPPAEVTRRLIDDPCFNIAAAGAIVRFYLGQDRGDVVKAVGDYHSHTPIRAAAYQAKVIHAASRLFNQPRPTPASRPRQIASATPPPPATAR